jgi:L-aminopeptidase/D-esterase-like protein
MSGYFAGVGIGHATDSEHHTGCTVFLCPAGTTGSVDVRGPAPGSRETDLLGLDKPLSVVNGVALSGGSAFGLATADGVMRYLAEQGIGHPTPVRPIPIVPAAIVYDLFLGGGVVLPDAAMGYAAAQQAAAQAKGDGAPVAQGNVGAGTGVTVGKWAGFRTMMKGGFGVAGVEMDGLEVWAAAVVNAIGDALNEDGSVLAGARAADGSWLAEQDPYRRFPERPPVWVGTNTTLVVVATNAPLNKIGCNRLAQRGHDGIAIALRPAHTTHDGDTVFALATGSYAGEREVGLDLVANVAVEMVAEAIRNGVRAAASVADVPGVGLLPGLAGGDG